VAVLFVKLLLDRVLFLCKSRIYSPEKEVVMPKLLTAKPLVIAALGVAVALGSSMAANAGVTSPNAPVTHSVIKSGTILITYFTGDTYPETAAGLSSCQKEGKAIVAAGGPNFSYSCEPGDPDAGLYNLWISKWVPGCGTCVKGQGAAEVLARSGVRP
jgi:hypothetical protein